MMCINIHRCCRGDVNIMEQVNEVLERIKRNAREISRLMAISIVNKNSCLTKIDESMAHIDSIRGLLTLIVAARVEDSLRALRSEVCATEDTTDGAPAANLSYTADRPLSGKNLRISIWHYDVHVGLMFTKYEFTVNQ